MHLYQVGALYAPGRTSWPDGVDYNYRSGQHELRIFMRGIQPPELFAYTKSKIQFALLVRGDIIGLLFQAGAVPWSDATFNIHLVPAAERTVPAVPAANEGKLLTIILVEGETGIIAALRVVSLSHAFSVALDSAIIQQAAAPFNTGDYDYQIAHWAQRDAGALAAQASVRCTSVR